MKKETKERHEHQTEREEAERKTARPNEIPRGQNQDMKGGEHKCNKQEGKQ